MTTIRKIVTSKIDGDSANNDGINEIRPYGEIAVYVGNNNKLELLMFDGVRTHVKSKVLNKGTFYGGDGDSGDGAGLDTIKLIPDAELYNNSDYNHQYLIVDPTAPNHIHLRAGGTIDQSNADLFLGGELNHIRVSDGYNNVVISAESNVGGTHTWTFDTEGKLTLPGESYSTSPSRISANYGIVLEPSFNGSGTGPYLRVDYNDGVLISPTTNDYSAGGKATALYLEGAYLSSGTLLPGDIHIDGGWNSSTQVKGAVNIGRGRTGAVNIGEAGVNTTLTFADGTEQTTAFKRTTGSWTLIPGANTVSFTVPLNGNYSMWVNGNIPNGIISWNATVNISNSNVPAIGSQYAWYYTTGNALVLNSIPDQIIGTSGTISTSNAYSGNSSNVFTFNITNNSAVNQVITWGHITL